MGNPFSKIIQNDVEYDVTPYAHKITITPNASETYASILARLFTMLKANVSDLITINKAEIHFINPNTGYHEIDFCTNKTRGALADRLTFIGGSFYSTELALGVVSLDRNCVYGEWEMGGSFSNVSSMAVPSAMRIELYYS